MSAQDNDPRYEDRLPSNQTAIDVCAGDWYSTFPSSVGIVEHNGTIELFADPRITWMCEQVGGVQNCHIVEIGPLEGAHTAILLEYGAASVVAIESNRYAYLRCLITKEVMGLSHAQFLCGDGLLYLESCAPDTFDVVLACGVLYHQREPLRFLRALMRAARTVLLSTHYAGDSDTPFLRDHAGDTVAVHDGMMTYQSRMMHYRQERDEHNFCGGIASYAIWLKRDDILDYLTRHNMTIIAVGCEERDHKLAPMFSVVARKADL